MDHDQVIEQYFTAIRGKDIEALAALYCDDATFSLPNGQEHHGREAIRALHAHVFASGGPMPTVQARIMGDRAAAVEIEALLPDGSRRRTTNHYHFDDAGKIRRLNVYMKSG